jgi:hypothetical protein
MHGDIVLVFILISVYAGLLRISLELEMRGGLQQEFIN